MDEEYQQERRSMKNNRPSDAKESFARGGKSLMMGFVSGVTGVVKQPLQGARKEGAAGFFKGFGKGLVGVVARPVGGIVDMASSTFEGIHKVAGKATETERMRPPRYVDKTLGIIQPYCTRKAFGAGVLYEVENGMFRKNQYIDHVKTRANGKALVFIIDNAMLSTHSGDVFGQW